MRLSNRARIRAKALLVAAALAASLLGYLAGSRGAGRQTTLSLRLINRSGQLHAIWNGSSPLVANAVGGTLMVVDGRDSLTFELDHTLLKSGAWPLVIRSADPMVELTLDIPGMGRVAEGARLAHQR